MPPCRVHKDNLEVELASSVEKKAICQESALKEVEAELQAAPELASNVAKMVTSREIVLREEALSLEVP